MAELLLLLLLLHDFRLKGNTKHMFYGEYLHYLFSLTVSILAVIRISKA